MEVDLDHETEGAIVDLAFPTTDDEAPEVVASRPRAITTGGRKSKKQKTMVAIDPHEAAKMEYEGQAVAQYGRGDKVPVKSIKGKWLKDKMKRLEERNKEAAIKAKDTELLLEEEPGFLEAEGMEKTFKFTQRAIKGELDVSTAKKSFVLKLPDLGPYCIDYSRTGGELLLGGRKGHLAAFDWRSGKLHTELQLNETIRDVKWFHNSDFFAVAQKKYVYVYDRQGTEIHCLKKHIEVTAMEFLPYHFLLATIGTAGWLKYQDTVTGSLICEHRTKLGVPQSMTQNPYNAIVHVGHSNGTVTLWSPSMSEPHANLLCHTGPVRAISVDRQGRYMATAGQEGRMNIWDLRMLKETHSYHLQTPASSLHISDRGLLAVGWGPHVTVWKDGLATKAKSPYLSHLSPASAIEDVRFCPFEDVLGFGHAGGFSSLIIPGAGEANFDAMEINPYASRKQKREGEVHQLLNRLNPDTISLDPDFIGRLNHTAKETKEARFEVVDKEKELEKKLVLRNRQRGKNSSLRRHLRKTGKQNIIDEQRLKLEALKKRRQNRGRAPELSKEALGPALGRFARSER